MNNLTKISSKDSILVIAFCLAVAAIMAAIVFSRNYMTFATETDFLGGFITEAKHYINGEPLEVRFHLPFYSIVLANVYYFVGDWFKSGVFLTIISSITVIACNFIFFHMLIGRAAAWGSIAILPTSYVFVSFSSYATTDMPFFALYSGCLTLSLLAAIRKSHGLWFISGVLIGLAYLTRANAITLFLIALLPLISCDTIKDRVVTSSALLVGMSAPIMIWYLYAASKGIPFTPTLSHINLALTYFSGSADRISGDARIPLEGKFSNLYQVLTYDPVYIAKTYIKDFYVTTKQVFFNSHFIQYPLALLAIPGLFLLFKSKPSKFFYAYLLLLAAQYALVNFKAYEHRYYLFLLPWLGAWAGFSFSYILGKLSSKKVSVVAISLASAIIIIVLIKNIYILDKTLHAHDQEFDFAIEAINENTPTDAIIMARKRHVGFYTSRKSEFLPDLEQLNDLNNYMLSLVDVNEIYLYYGSVEQRRRKQFLSILNKQTRPGWLQLVATSPDDNDWMLFKYVK